jgi:hypothetical protein
VSYQKRKLEKNCLLVARLLSRLFITIFIYQRRAKSKMSGTAEKTNLPKSSTMDSNSPPEDDMEELKRTAKALEEEAAQLKAMQTQLEEQGQETETSEVDSRSVFIGNVKNIFVFYYSIYSGLIQLPGRLGKHARGIAAAFRGLRCH